MVGQDKISDPAFLVSIMHSLVGVKADSHDITQMLHRHAYDRAVCILDNEACPRIRKLSIAILNVHMFI